ncbi:MAG: hypothetical protein LUC27_02525, partial [Lachnospiraceae bacterium]|nr:hypothetical protein [Lachnospiraceae bacterium]
GYGRGWGGMEPPPPRRRRSGVFFWPIFGPRTVYVNGSGNSGRMEYQESRRTEREEKQRKKGIPGWYKVLCVIMVIVVIALLFSAARARSAAANTVTREKLGADACVSTDQVLDDELGWITNTGIVEDAIDYFYDKTGVQTYLLICDNLGGQGGDITDDEAEEYLETLYDSLFSDEGHMIFVFMEYETSRYVTFLYTGVSADSVIDSDARGIFLDNADYYYTDMSLSDEEYFAKIFTASADTIMEDAAGNARSATLYVVLSVVILIVMVAGLILFKVAEQKRLEAEEMRRILNTPVGSTENSPEEEDLIHKYTDE